MPQVESSARVTINDALHQVRALLAETMQHEPRRAGREYRLAQVLAHLVSARTILGEEMDMAVSTEAEGPQVVIDRAITLYHTDAEFHAQAYRAVEIIRAARSQEFDLYDGFAEAMLTAAVVALALSRCEDAGEEMDMADDMESPAEALSRLRDAERSERALRGTC